MEGYVTLQWFFKLISLCSAKISKCYTRNYSYQHVPYIIISVQRTREKRRCQSSNR